MAFFKRFTLGLALVLAFAFCGPVFAAETIKLGVAGAHSGNLAGYGMGTLNATKIVAEKVNAAGGIAGGKMIEVVAQDEQCKPELATNVASKLIADDVRMIVGHICTGATTAALPLYNEAKVISVSPSATAPEITASGKNPYFFRTIASDDDQARIGVYALENVIKAKKVAILHDKGDYGRGYADFVRQFLAINNKVEVVLFEGITSGASDFSPIIQKVRSSGAEALVFGGYDPDAAKIVSQMQRRKVNIPMVAPDGIRVESFLRLAGKAAEGTFASGTRDLSDSPMYIEATEAHQKMFGTPPPAQFYMQGYAAALAAVNAIDKAGSDRDVNKMLEVLRTDYVDTPLGKIRFDQKGDAEGVGFALFKVVNGKFVEVTE
ncbi:branched-chain amino acid ABC transporter substrate-binding protein [Desulfovibrio sp. OttesenSCG-928-F07]|nr:branched-chain amino acid ABC transporter substrate-binding protein [Desulfovibrio sp. OttesenSCG-928-F07]